MQAGQQNDVPFWQLTTRRNVNPASPAGHVQNKTDSRLVRSFNIFSLQVITTLIIAPLQAKLYPKQDSDDVKAKIDNYLTAVLFGLRKC